MTPVIQVLLLRPAFGPGFRAVERVRAEAALLDATGVDAIGRLCPRCGSTDHGRPWVRGGVEATSVSLSYTAAMTLAAWSTTGQIGIDVELDDGRDAGAYGDLSTWTRAEAIVKATGEGLRRDPSDLPDIWSAPLLELPDGYVGYVALAGLETRPLDVRVSIRVPSAPADGAGRWEAYTPLTGER